MVHSRQLAAIMFTDIVGYTALMQQNEGKAIRVREKHRLVFNTCTKAHNGKILQYYGDGTLSIFDSALDAVNCGIKMQQGFQEDPAIPVRIGIHTGDIIFSEEEIIGDSVNVASRIESLAVAGSVFISDKVYDEIKNQESLQTSLLKTFKLKNVEKPIQVYAISNRGMIVPKAEDVKGKTEKNKEMSIAEKQQQNLQWDEGNLSEIILSTKLYIPPPPLKVVSRERLVKQINEGLKRKLLLISAPAGFGKTTIVSEWLAAYDKPIAWLSLDEDDNDPARFLSYLIAALKTIFENIGKGALNALHSPQPPPAKTILSALLHEISQRKENFVLVLDDYHIIKAKTVDELLSFLLEQMPLQMKLVITTREDPRFPLARLRIRGHLAEIRASDLRFTAFETTGFLNHVLELGLSASEIEILENRTEGWIAGLQLAGISLQETKDTSGFIKSFSGSNRFVLDYLVEEVLQRLPENIVTFLLNTSILIRLCGSLCDAVTSDSKQSGQEILEFLENANLFVVSLDDHRKWYRYQHLFSDFLKARLTNESSTLHLRASKWYEKNSLSADAVRHAILAEDFERSAALIELAWPEMDRSCQSSTWLGWVKVLPEKIVKARPVLSAGYAWALLENGKLEEGELRLRDVEFWLDRVFDEKEGAESSLAGMVIVDKVQFSSLKWTVANARAYHAQTLGNVAGTIKYARLAIELMIDGDYIERGIPFVLLGFAHWTSGELEKALTSFSDVKASFKKENDIAATLSISFIISDILIALGRLKEATNLLEHSLQLAKEQGDELPRGTAELYFGLGELYREKGNLELARKYIVQSEEVEKQINLSDWDCRSRWCIDMARLAESNKDYKYALQLLDEAESLYCRNPVPIVRPVSALKAKIWLRQGRLFNTQEWVKINSLSVDDEMTYLNEFDHIVLVRLLLAEYKNKHSDQIFNDCLKLCERLLEAAKAGERKNSAIEILILQALLYESKGEINKGLRSLQKALYLAEPEGYFRIFVEEGEPMLNLLEKLLDRGVQSSYSVKLMAAVNAEK